MRNLISLANKPILDPIAPKVKYHLPVTFFVGPLVLPNEYYQADPGQCTKSVKVYTDKAQKIKSAYNCI